VIFSRRYQTFKPCVPLNGTGILTMSKLQIILSAKICRISAIVTVDFHCRVNSTHVYFTGFTCVNKIQEIVLYLKRLVLNVKVESG